MGRISRESMFMGMARLASMRSTCHRLNVGAIVVQGNNPIAVGWGGHEPGAPHCPGNTCPGITPGNCPTIHAEVNALKKAEAILQNGPDYRVDLYCTHSPCRSCAEYIRFVTPLSVRRIFFEIPYRDTSHLNMFELDDPDNPLILMADVLEVTPAGYIVNYFTRQVVELP
jgi:dCMP deaminase